MLPFTAATRSCAAWQACCCGRQCCRAQNPVASRNHPRPGHKLWWLMRRSDCRGPISGLCQFVCSQTPRSREAWRFAHTATQHCGSTRQNRRSRRTCASAAN